MELNTINSAQSALSTPATGNQQPSKVSSDFETFLKMLTAQLENQDPLDPVKSEDFAVQLATFSGVEQQVLTNDLLKNLSDQIGLSGMAQFANWVGMEARAPVVGQFDGDPIMIFPKPEATAQGAVLVVSNSAGEVVQRASIPVSEDPLEWTGQTPEGALPDGLYSFNVESISNGQVSTTAPVELYTRVIETRLQNGAAILVTEGGVEVEASAITALRNP